MNCRDLLQKLTDHTDGALDTVTCADLERHLAECSSCASLRADFEHLALLCRQLQADVVPLPPDTRSRIEALLRPQ